MRLLLVEDDTDLAGRLAPALTQLGYAVDHAANGIDAEHLGRVEPYDLIVLDLGLPGRPGLTVLQHWRADGIATPVVILTARDAWHERVEGFKAGADDYVGKPFHVEELAARIQAVLRRAHGESRARVDRAGLMLDEDRQEVSVDGGPAVALTATEFRLLRYFMLHPGQLLSKTRLTEAVYDQDFDRDSNLIEVYVRRLRERIGVDRIRTRRGQGYVFADDPAP
ncbi:MAG: response regulator transcription factor [Gammaproteobacteria bacterium]|nr:response regulator transcription factor [Gammaproteobacteria bacterium]